MFKRITMSFFWLSTVIFSNGYTDESEYKERIADAYDQKTNDINNLNYKLAEKDGLFFNHNGILAHGDSVEWYANRLQSEEDLLLLVHALEKNNVYNAIQYLGCPNKGAVILDAGCGAGGCGLMLHEAFGSLIEGFTLSQGQADFANSMAIKRGCQDKVHFYQGDMLKIDRLDNSYDYIWACESTEHASNLYEMFEEFTRVAKPDARLIIIAWCAFDPKLKEIVDEHYITQIHSADEYLEAARNTGWKSLTIQDITERTAQYWQIRSLSKNATGAESFMGPGFSSRNLQYYLFTFENQKRD